MGFVRGIPGLAPAVMLLAAAACATPSEPHTAALPPGCFRLTLGAWSASHEAADPPPYLTLENTVGTDGFEAGHLVVRAVPTGATSAYPWMYWTAPSGDYELDLVFTGGYVGVDVSLLRGADSWKGTASAFSDIGGSATATAELSPMVCPP